jgi:hypothetical protein
VFYDRLLKSGEVTMVDRLLSFGTTFDWISPTLAFIQDIANGPSCPFFVPYNAGWSGREIERLLKHHGIKVWGLMIVNDAIMFSVRQAQARWTLYVLERAGVPIQQYGSLGEFSGKHPKSKAKNSSVNLIEAADRLVDKLAKALDW